MSRRNIFRVLDLARTEQMIVLVLLVSLLGGIVWRSQIRETLFPSPVTVLRSPKAAEARIDINSAPWHDLVILPGIGPKLAQKIVALRATKEGRRFERIEEIAEAKGISTRMVERIRPYVCLGKAKRSGKPGVAK